MTSSGLQELSFQRALAESSPRLGREEEAELVRRWRHLGDRRAADTLARAHLRTVTSLAIKYRHYGVSTSELVAEGNCGLVHALRKFDPERGVRFMTYAVHWIRAHILAYVVRSKSLVGGCSGPMRSQLFFKLRRERARLTAIWGEQAAAGEALAERMGMSVERVGSLLRRLDATDLSLDLPANLDAAPPLLERLASTDDPEQSFSRAQLSFEREAAIAAVLGCLDRRERMIVEQRLMAEPEDERSLADLAREMGVSRERARQLEQRAKRKLKSALLSRRHSDLPSARGVTARRAVSRLPV